MYREKKRKIISGLLILVMLLSLCVSSAFATTQSEIDALQSQRDSLKKQQSGIQSTIDSLKAEQSSTIELKTALDEKNTLTLQQMQNLQQQIDLHTQLIEQKNTEVVAAQKAADEQLHRYQVRVRNMEENGRYSYIEVLFGASSIGEFLSLIDDIGDIIRSDKELERAYRQSVADLEAVKAEYVAAKEELEAKNEELEALSKQLQADIEEAAQLISALQDDIDAHAAELADIASQGDDMDAQIAKLTRQLNEERKKAEEEARRRQQESGGGSSSGGTVIVGTGSLSWPSYTTSVGSPYGYRIHPIYGTYKLHGGVDIRASYGTAITASDGGTVVVSQDGWNGGWGNYVMIDHGNGLQTLYAHMSSRAVSYGQTVSKGQVIGYVGSTGASTGPHLHYEVWANGSRTDPMNYFK